MIEIAGNGSEKLRPLDADEIINEKPKTNIREKYEKTPPKKKRTFLDKLLGRNKDL